MYGALVGKVSALLMNSKPCESARLWFVKALYAVSERIGQIAYFSIFYTKQVLCCIKLVLKSPKRIIFFLGI